MIDDMKKILQMVEALREDVAAIKTDVAILRDGQKALESGQEALDLKVEAIHDFQKKAHNEIMGHLVQTTSEHCLPRRGMKPTVSDQRNLLD